MLLYVKVLALRRSFIALVLCELLYHAVEFSFPLLGATGELY